MIFYVRDVSFAFFIPWKLFTDNSKCFVMCIRKKRCMRMSKKYEKQLDVICMMGGDGNVISIMIRF